MLFGEEECRGLRDRRIEWSRFLKAGDKFGERFGIHDRAGKLVSADFASFFQDVNIFSRKSGLGAAGIVLLDEIGKMQRATQPGGPRADDQDVRFQLFALDGHFAILPNLRLATISKRSRVFGCSTSSLISFRDFGRIKRGGPHWEMNRTSNLGLLFATTPLLLVIFLIGGAGRYLPDGSEVPVIAIILLCPIIACFLGHHAIGELKGASPQQAKSARIIAKVAATLGYLELFAMLILIAAAPFHHSNPMAANESSAVGSLRSLNAAAMHYQLAHPEEGFPSALKSLSPSCGVDASWTLDATLTSGLKSGYRFTFMTGERNNDGRILRYKIYADPIEQGKTGQRHFFTDETGVIRYGLEQAADSTSSALQ
jgi:type IV pilus assembly protein PilA